MNPTARPTLADRHYYLSNFRLVLDWLEDRYGDLLDEGQHRFLNEFKSLEKPSQALMVRMVMRKADLFRATKLNYAEIGATDAAIAPLLTLGWAEEPTTLSMEELFALLRKDELARLFDLPRAMAAQSKADLLEALRPTSAGMPLARLWPDHSGEKFYRLLVGAQCERLRLMYFGNFHQTWSEFVLADLGVFTYERVDLSRASRAFQSREQIEGFHRLFRCRARLHEDEDPQSILADLPAPIPDCDWLEQRRAKLLFQIARRCEQRREVETAAALYAQCSHPGSALRAALLHERAHEPVKARATCLAGLRTPHEAPDAARLTRVLARLDRKLGGARPSTARVRIPQFTIQVPPPAAPQSVEQSALEFLSAAPDSGRVFYVENILINGLFGLLCWEAIFAPLPGAFFHPFQHGPADLSSPEFHARRADRFGECLNALDSEAYKTVILRHFRDKHGLASPFLAWRALQPEVVSLAIDCFPATHLRHWCEWILRDVNGNSAGFPDLVQFWPQERRYRLLEIKGPGDRLQDNQRRLFEYCIERDMPVTVCHLRWDEPSRGGTLTAT